MIPALVEEKKKFIYIANTIKTDDLATQESRTPTATTLNYLSWIIPV